MGGGGGNEPGSTNAMAAHSAAGLEHIDAGVVVGRRISSRIDPKVIAHQRELVGEAMFTSRKLFSVSFTSSAVRAVVANSSADWREGLASNVGGGRNTDHAVVADQLLEDAAWQHPLGTVGDMELLAAEAALLGDHLSHLLSGAHRRGGQQHEIAGSQDRRNGTGCGST